MKRTLTFHEDPGHGWLAVSLEDLAALGIAEDITNFSYMTSNRAFLEEDRDAAVYLDAAKKQGWTVKVERKYSRKSRIRTYASYNPYWVKNTLGIGTIVYVPGLKHQAKIVRETKNRWILNTGHGVPKRNPFRYVLPVELDPKNDEQLLKELDS